MSGEDLASHVERALADAPLLTESQRADIAALLRAARRERAVTSRTTRGAVDV